MEFKGKNILVIGAGKSGVAASGFLLAKGAAVTLADSDVSKGNDPKISDLASMGAVFVFGDYPKVRSGSYDHIVVSPGVPLTIEPVVKAEKLGVPVIGELELAFAFAEAPLVAITGTNGKTTTTVLTGEIFKNAGFRTLVAGNIGHPLVREIESYNSTGVVIAEVSSFQLESTRSFKPKVAAILNITPDHLDRHGRLEDYIGAKAKVFEKQDADDYLILNFDDPTTAGLAAKCPGKVIFFSRKNNLDCGVFLSKDGMIVSAFDGANTEIMPAGDLGIPGPHNLENALAAVACALLFNIDPEEISGTLREFPGVEHRLEFVRELHGVRYVNDSKGTNPDASIKALDSFDQPIILIAGGRNKGNDFLSFSEKVKQKARLVVTLGECADEIEDSFLSVGFKDFTRAEGFEEAVLEANKNAKPGDLVLLSPACASWDMFGSYEERGKLFKKVVNDLEVTKCR